MNSKYYLIQKTTFLYLEDVWEEKNNRNFKRFNRDLMAIFIENREKIGENRYFRR